ncbi:MAG: hypothetical protein F6K39_43770, partial [Okeania sp. SIO3B3]|nr:hypothetical protein [Okeania sp. SIO3B3]
DAQITATAVLGATNTGDGGNITINTNELNIAGELGIFTETEAPAAETIYEVVDPNANIIFGAVIDEKMQGEIKITVIATGFSGEAQINPTQEIAQPRRSIPTPTSAPTQSVEQEKKLPGLDIPDFLQRRRTPPSNR